MAMLLVGGCAPDATMRHERAPQALALRDAAATVTEDASTASRSARELLEAARAQRGGSYREALAHLSGEALHRIVQEGRAQRTVAWEFAPDAEAPRDALDVHARTALASIGAEATGPVRVRWDAVMHAPLALDRLAFVRRGASPSEVWQEWLRAHGSDLRRLWGIADDDDLRVSEVRPLGTALQVVRGQRYRAGLPVEGQFFEARVTTAASVLGAGVLIGVGGRWAREVGVLPTTPRAQWLDAEAVTRVLPGDARGLGERTEASLRLTCDAVCRPWWRLHWADGRETRVDALEGRVVATHMGVLHRGPVTTNGLPPQVAAEVPIRLRGAHVLDLDSVTLGNLSPATAEHEFDSNDVYRVRLEGALGSSNPDAIGRVFASFPNGTPAQFSQFWVSSPFPDMHFNWSPVGGSLQTLPHSTQLVYGWMAYHQDLFRRVIGSEVMGRLSFQFDSTGFGRGISGNSFTGGNLTPPDSNGATTSGHIAMSADPADVQPTQWLLDGSYHVSIGHEYGHTIQACAAEAGAGCDKGEPGALDPSNIQRNDPALWRFHVDGSSKEDASNAIAVLLARYAYNNGGFTGGSNWVPTWRYISYDSPDDDFATSTQDTAAGNPNCAIQGPCPSGFACIVTNAHFSTGQAGMCARLSNPGPCGTALSAVSLAQWPLTTPPTMVNVCWPETANNRFWATVGARLSMTTDWSTALQVLLHGLSGQSNNALRDLITGGDNYYQRYLDNTEHRFEVTRAVESVYAGAGFVRGDDFTDRPRAAIPVTVSHAGPTKIWWGNDPDQYPLREDWLDADVVTFRGLAGARYVVTASGVNGAGLPIIDVSDPAGNFVGGSLNGSVTIGPLANTGWYHARFWGIVPGAWMATLAPTTDSDDFAQTPQEAYPMPHGAWRMGTATSGDQDAFKMYVPETGGSLTVELSGTVEAWVYLFRPNGSYFGSGSISGTGSVVFSGVDAVGDWRWYLVAFSAGNYSTRAVLSCAAGATPCDLVPTVRNAVESWGDWFAGRAPVGSATQHFRVTLQERETVAVGISDTEGFCPLQIEVFGPTTMGYFGSLPIMRWTTGGHAGPSGWDTPTAGGSLEAPQGGAYEFRVSPQSGMGCDAYRFYVARTGQLGPAWPGW